MLGFVGQSQGLQIFDFFFFFRKAGNWGFWAETVWIFSAGGSFKTHEAGQQVSAAEQLHRAAGTEVFRLPMFIYLKGREQQ